MIGTQPTHPPLRVTDLIERHRAGATIVFHTTFDILPVDFDHRSHPFKAYIFLCQYSGTIDDHEFSFRKCYARGCPHNLCPHVSQAVLIANRYLQRDYHRLEAAGIAVEKKLFSLEKMVLSFDRQEDTGDSAMALPDYVQLAREGRDVSIRPSLEFVSAVEHFDRFETKTMFLMADFAVTCEKKTIHLERCLACYPVDKAAEERSAKIELANARLKLLYEEVESAGGRIDKPFFE